MLKPFSRHDERWGVTVSGLLQMMQASKTQIIAAIYETVLRPELMDRFSLPAEQREEDVVTSFPFRGQKALQASEMRTHFSRAFEILEQQWRQAGEPGYSGALPHPDLGNLDEVNPTGGGGWVLLGLDRSLLHSSRLMAAPDLETGGGSAIKDGDRALAALQVGLSARGSLRGFSQRVARGDFSWQELLILETCLPGKLLLCRPVWLGSVGTAIMIEVLDAIWPVGADRFLAESFGVELQDVELLRESFEGRGRVLTPLKTLGPMAAKVGAPGVLELMRLTSFLLRQFAEDQKVALGQCLPPQQLTVDSQGVETQCFRLGAETGQPVIFVHGMLDGVAGIQRLQPELRRRGFRVYVPLRGGYGASRPVPKNNEQLDAFVAQIEALMDQENLQRPILLAHRSGAIFARAVALKLQGRIGGVVGVAPELPLKQTRNYKNLRGHHKGLAICASIAPPLVPMVLRSWARSVRRRGASTLMRRQAQPGSRAMADFNRLKLDPVLGLSHDLIMQQGGAGFLADLTLSKIDDWMQARRNVTPTIYLCGEEETSLPPESLYPAIKGEERIQTRICADAGNVLLYVRPELVLAALEEMASETEQEAIRV